eukprot:6586804-Prymnesium_polylepis.1
MSDVIKAAAKGKLDRVRQLIDADAGAVHQKDKVCRARSRARARAPRPLPATMSISGRRVAAATSRHASPQPRAPASLEGGRREGAGARAERRRERHSPRWPCSAAVGANPRVE